MGVSGGGSVLIVDDEADVAAVVAELVGRLGYGTMVAHGAVAALDLLRTRDPDVVLLDVHLPGMNGLELLRVLRTTRPLLPVVMLTGLTDPEVLFALRTAGAADYVAKPLLTQDLPGVLATHVAASRQRRGRA